MKVGRTSPRTGQYNEIDLPITEEQMRMWHSGHMIQHVMPQLSAEQREFVLTGYTPEDWEAMFPPDEDE